VDESLIGRRKKKQRRYQKILVLSDVVRNRVKLDEMQKNEVR